MKTKNGCRECALRQKKKNQEGTHEFSHAAERETKMRGSPKTGTKLKKKGREDQKPTPATGRAGNVKVKN